MKEIKITEKAHKEIKKLFSVRQKVNTLKSDPDAAVYSGTGVICKESVIYNGSSITNNAKLECCFVGEACKITDGFTAENSLSVNAPGKNVTIKFQGHTLTLKVK